MNRSCRHTPALLTEKVGRLPRQFGPGAVHHVVREVVQQIVNCAANPAEVFQCVRSGTPKLLTITGTDLKTRLLFLNLNCQTPLRCS